MAASVAVAARVSGGVGETRIARWGEAMLPPLLGLSVVVFTLGSSSHGRLAQYGLVARWLFLFALLGIAALAAFAFGNRARPTGLPLLGTCFVALAGASVAWSDWPRLTAARAVSLAILFAVVALIAWLAAGRPEIAARVVWSIVIAVSVIAAGGFVLAVLEPGAAFQTSTPWRFRGLGQNPNTVALLGAVTAPMLVWASLRAPPGRRRVGSVVGLVLLVQTIFLTGSRGAIFAATPAVALQLWLARSPRAWRAKALVVLTAVVLFGLFGAALVQSAVSVRGDASPTHGTQLAPLASRDAAPRAADACTPAEVAAARAQAPPPPEPSGPVQVKAPEAGAWIAGVVLLLPRAQNFWNFSGRTEAWSAALGAAWARPLAGYGFGTETDVFAPLKCGMKVFQGGRAENSYIGSFLELGILGAGLLIGLVGVALAQGAAALKRVAPEHRDLVLALIAAVVAGALAAIVQSYLYSAGNLATLPFWTAAFLLAALARRLPRSRHRVSIFEEERFVFDPASVPSWVFDDGERGPTTVRALPRHSGRRGRSRLGRVGRGRHR